MFLQTHSIPSWKKSKIFLCALDVQKSKQITPLFYSAIPNEEAMAEHSC
jgi:hypothetical protein